jgi:hypothetical protein
MSGGLGGFDLSTSVASMKLSDEPRLIETFTEDISRELSGAFADVKVIALDLEGVDLSRAGRISIVQVSTPARCFLIDVLGKGPDDLVVCWLRSLLQSENILKVIHDSRMDSDALFHLLKIELVNVHDTSCWQAVIGIPDTSLNDTLRFHNLAPNIERDKSVYQRNHAFWATRPLTRQMLDWASGDVQFMFDLYQRQLEKVEFIRNGAARARALTLEFLSRCRLANLSIVTVKNPGKFIGPRGSNIRGLQERTGTTIYGIGPWGSQQFMVFHNTEAEKEAVTRAARS